MRIPGSTRLQRVGRGILPRRTFLHVCNSFGGVAKKFAIAKCDRQHAASVRSQTAAFTGLTSHEHAASRHSLRRSNAPEAQRLFRRRDHRARARDRRQYRHLQPGERVLLRPLPFPDADRIIYLEGKNLAAGITESNLSFLDFTDWSQQTDLFASTAAYWTGTANFGADGAEPERVPV